MHRDELLFQIVHQSTELWLKLACAELCEAGELIRKGEAAAAARLLDRSSLCVELVTGQLKMLRHLSPWSFQTIRTGWAERAHDPVAFLNGRHTPGISVGCARWLAEETPLAGVGVETVGTDAGLAGEFEQPYPCHWHLHGAGKYGLTQLRNLALLPPTGSVLIAGPLPIVGGSGSPTRVLALVEREA